MLKSRYFCGGSVMAVALALSGQAFAQESSTVEEVVVTGSFIAGTPEDAALPVDVINSEDLEKQGSPSTVELLKALPVSSGVLGDTNQFDPRAQGSEGSGSVNLRGLGAQRTLVLMNGHRMAINPFATGVVDTNVIPAAAIGRVEVLKDGAAATYGSDAIAGVVNFITRKNFDGLEMSASYRFIDGSDGDYTGSVLWGHTFENGNILFSAAYQHRSELSTTERDWATRSFFDNPEGGWSAGNAIAPFLPVTNNGAGAFIPAAGFQLDRGCTPLGGVATPGALPVCQFAYIPYDNLVEIEDRFQLYGEANARLGDNAELYVSAFYAETDVPEWKTSPSYLALQTPTAATNPTVGQLPASVLAGYFVPAANPGFIAYRNANPDQVPAFATGAHIPGLRYRPFSVGGNPAFDYGSSEGRRHYDAFRVSGGVKGKFANDIGYDLTLTYGQETGVRTGYDTVVSRFQLALRGYGSLNDGTAGGCTAAETNNYTTGAGNAALGCYWFNPFSNAIANNTVTGQTNPAYNSALANDPELVRWFFQEVATKQSSKLFVTDLVFNGELPWELGGGAVGWAAGAQFRRSFFSSNYNDLSNIDANPCIDTIVTGSTSCAVRNGPLMFLGTGENADLEGDVYAVFAEMALPITDDLQVQLAARFEDYGGETGSTVNPKASVRWQATDWLAFRASAGSTFRGPPLTQLTTSSVTALSFIGGAFRAIDIYGNPSLEPEKAKTYSAGAIFNLGAFKGSVDYWRFDFENPIVAEPSASMVNTMFPGGASSNCDQAAFAGLQSRFVFQGACSIATIARVRTFWSNGPAVKTSGVDVLADYDFGDVMGGDLRIGGSATYTIEYKVDPFSIGGVTVEKAFDAAGYLNYQLTATSLPQLKGSVFAEYTHGAHNLRWTVNYIGSYIDQRASIFAPNAVNGAIQPNGAKIDETWVHEIDYRWLAPWDVTVNLSIDNVFDAEPSFARLDLNYDPFTGSALGRTYKVSVKKKF